MSDESQSENPIDPIAEDFVSRLRRGEHPSLTEYIARHPILADEIRDLFPALVLMEKARPLEHGKANLASQLSNLEKPPERLDDFRIVREIGRGGMGVVYEAIQESLGRQVALKILPRRTTSKDSHSRRFQREARAAARLNHPNIVPVYSVGEIDGVHYYAMQFIRGVGLDVVTEEIKRIRSDGLVDKQTGDNSPSPECDNSFIELVEQSATELAQGMVSGVFSLRVELPDDVANDQRQPSTVQGATWDAAKTLSIHESGRAYWTSVARIGENIALALQYAADQGVLHRDIKPANLLLDLEGKVWVTDFGLATELAGDGLTQTGDIIGTLRYMAPERLHGASSPLVDVYSLGATLYELLTLKPMFGDLPRDQMLQAVSSVAPKKPRSVDPRIPKDLETIVLKALAKEPKDRYSSAKLMAEDLRRFLDGKPILARGASALDQIGKWSRRNPAVASLLSILAVLVPLLLTGAWVSNVIRAERDEAIRQRELATEAREKSDVLSERARVAEQESRVRAHLARAKEIQQSGKEGQRFHCLEEIRLAALLNPPEDLKKELTDCAISALGLTDIQPKIEFETDFSGPSRFNHTGTQVVQVVINRAALSELKAKTLESQKIDSDFCLKIRSSDDWNRVTKLPGPGFSCYNALLDYSIDDRFLLVTYFRNGMPNRMICYDATSHEIVHSSDIHTMDFDATIAHHPNGRLIAYENSEAELILWDLVDRKEYKRFRLGYSINDCCFDSIGTELALISSDGKTISFIDVETGAEKRRLQNEESKSSVWLSIAWSSDDQLIAACRTDASIDVWSVPQQRLCSVMQGHLSRITSVSFSKRGYLLCTYSYDGSSRLWNASLGKELLVSERQLLGYIREDQLAFTTGTGRTAGVCTLSHEDAIRRLHDPSIGSSRIASQDQGIRWATFSPDETIALVYGSSFVDFWDVNNQRKLHRLSIDNCHRVLFHSSGSYFITLQSDQLLKWPVQQSQNDGESVVFCGPPEVVQIGRSEGESYNWFDACWLKNKDHLALFNGATPEVLIKDMSQPTSADSVGHLSSRYSRAATLAASPDGRWLAAGIHHIPEAGVQVWDLETQIRIEIAPNPLDIAPSYSVGFTNDSRWLVVTVAKENFESGHAIYETGTWRRHDFRPTQTSPGLPVFFRNTSHLATLSGPNEVRISDVDSGEVATTLQIREARFNAPIALLENDTKLAINSASIGNDILIWDLAEIKLSLQQIGLRWGLEIDDRTTSTLTSRVKFSIDEATLVDQTRRRIDARETLVRAEFLLAASKVDEAIALIDSTQTLSSQSPYLMNNIAWSIVCRRDCTRQQAECAIRLVEQSIALLPKERSLWNTLGVAFYRSGEFHKAIENLNKSAASQSGADVFYDAIFIAMCRWKLDEHPSAREWYSKSMAAFEQTPTPPDEMKRFRAEAEALIRVE